MKMNAYLILTVVVVLLVLSILIFYYYSTTPKEVGEPKPELTAVMDECLLDTRGEGTFSFFFDVKIEGNKTRLPAQIFFKINKIYNLEQYEIVREYDLNKVYGINETISNISFIISDLYKDYMYLPSQNFDFQLFYCEFTESQKDYMLYSNASIFNALDDYCIMIYDYEMLHEGYIHVVSQNAGEQCNVIQRESSA